MFSGYGGFGVMGAWEMGWRVEFELVLEAMFLFERGWRNPQGGRGKILGLGIGLGTK